VAYARTGWALLYTVVSAFSIALMYKIVTGRTSPPHHEVTTDISNQFHFGFMQEQVMGGWPSSHTTIAFAMAACLIALFPESSRIKIIAYTYALLVGLGVAIGFHWFSEFLAGVLIGTVVGRVAATRHAVQT
jgi:membrane-associated phospholipid phosphatase